MEAPPAGSKRRRSERLRAASSGSLSTSSSSSSLSSSLSSSSSRLAGSAEDSDGNFSDGGLDDGNDSENNDEDSVGGENRQDYTQFAEEEETEEIAQMKLRSLDIDVEEGSINNYKDIRTPMAFACFLGDLPMCIYLYNHGAAGDVTCEDADNTPMSKACNGFNGVSHLHVMKWLFRHGAQGDIRRLNSCGQTVLANCEDVPTMQWLISQGALNDEASINHISRSAVQRNIRERKPKPFVGFLPDRVPKGFFARPKILPELRAWAEEVGCCAPLRAYARGFLLGTVTGAEAPKTAEKATAAAPPPPLMMIGGAGHEGLRELVGEFVGLTKEKLREARNAREVLAHMVALGLGDREELGEDDDDDDDDDGGGDDD